jgi:hypothetical protein
MAKKKTGIGTSEIREINRRKRKGRHTKTPNKSKTYKKYRGQGRG